MGKPLSGITPSQCKEHYSTPAVFEENKLSSTSFQSLKNLKSLLCSLYLLMVPSVCPVALQIMGNESLSASGVDVSHDVEQKALLNLQLFMNILHRPPKGPQRECQQNEARPVYILYYARDMYVPCSLEGKW